MVERTCLIVTLYVHLPVLYYYAVLVLLFHALCEAAKVIFVTARPAVLHLVVFERRVRGIRKGTPPHPPPNLQWLIRHKSHNE
jgi:hypothetical protein